MTEAAQRVLGGDPLALCTYAPWSSSEKMSVRIDESVFVARLQKKVTFTRVTGAIEASVKALGYEKVTRRQEQFDIVLNFLKGNDVFVSLPTRGGKSLCYACLPFVYDRLREDTSRSIAPLNALMQDQVTSFTKRGMTAVHVGRDCSLSLVDKIISGEVQLIYMSL